MDNRYSKSADARSVGAVCIFILGGILIAGLWPFHPPRNEVNRLKNEYGLHFGRYGDAVSAGAFQVKVAKDRTSCSLEIWLAPSDPDQANTILAFDSSPDPTEPFSLEQDRRDLVIKRLVLDRQGRTKKLTLKVRGIFRDRSPVFVTITAGGQNTAVYRDGTSVTVSRGFGMSGKDISGRLVVAGSTVNDSWSGQMLGLAIYRKQLTPGQVSEHYGTWTRNLRPFIASDEVPTALYDFNERNGDVVRNQVDPTTDLTIPARYLVLHPQLLQPAWRDYRFGLPGWSYWKDVAINIAGFVPLGFCFLSYFSSVRHIKRAAGTVIVLGFLLSLAIETSQRLLPTRDSDMTDVITNTLGTVLGVLACRWTLAHKLFTGARDRAVSVLENLSRIFCQISADFARYCKH